MAAKDGVNVDAAGLKEKLLALGLRPVLRGAGACLVGGMYSSFSSQLILTHLLLELDGNGNSKVYCCLLFCQHKQYYQAFPLWQAA